MSWITLSSKKVKTKKEHMCHGCNTKYQANIYMQKTVSVDGGDFSSIYWCMPCEEFMSDKWNELDGDGIGEGECWEYPDYKEFREQWVAHNK